VKEADKEADIVKRLRWIADDYDDVGWHADVLEAADEIERLRMALEDIAGVGRLRCVVLSREEMEDRAFDVLLSGKND
jgi:hypothetical protein